MLFKAQNQKNGARFKGVTSARTAIRPFKIAVLNLETCIQACSTVLIHLYHAAAILESLGNKGFVFALSLPVQPHIE